MKKSVLIITNHYMDDNNGGANCSKAYIRALSELFPNTTLMYPKREKDVGLCFIPPAIKAIPVYDDRSMVQKVVDIYRGVLTRMVDSVRNHLGGNKYDVIVVDHSVTASGIMSFLKKTGSKIVTIHHNDETQYLKDNKPFFLYRIPKMHFAAKAENECLLTSCLNITLTEHDAQTFAGRFPTKIIHAHCVGTFQYENLPESISIIKRDNRFTFAITGSLYFPQSSKPVVEFVDKYYPIILKKVPKAKLIVAGRNPSNHVKEICAKHSSIELVPNPEDIQAVIKRADYYICPINMGSGVKLRAMDGLCQGLPVLSHIISTNGYEKIVEDGYMFGYDDEPSFEASLTKMLSSDCSSQEVYRSFYSYFSFEAGKARLKAILEKEGLI